VTQCFNAVRGAATPVLLGGAWSTHLAPCSVPLSQRCEHVTVELPLSSPLAYPTRQMWP